MRGDAADVTALPQPSPAPPERETSRPELVPAQSIWSCSWGTHSGAIMGRGPRSCTWQERQRQEDRVDGQMVEQLSRRSPRWAIKASNLVALPTMRPGL